MSGAKGKVMGAVGSDIVGNVRTVIGDLSAAEKLHESVSHIRKAHEELEKLQKQYAPDQPAWRQCETVDDHLFEALRLLGD